MADRGDVVRSVKSLLTSLTENSASILQKRKRKDREDEEIQTEEESNKLFKGKIIQPLDYESFMKRVDTFTTCNWFAKPFELNPLVCALWGWQILDIDLLECVSCKAKLYGKLPKAVDASIYPECCKKLRGNLEKHHEKSCYWRSHPSPENFMKINLRDRYSCSEQFYSRIKFLSTVGMIAINFESLDRQLQHKTKNHCGVEKILHRFLKKIDDCTSVAPVALALCGWSSENCGPEMIQCSKCRRKAGLWNCKQVENPVSMETENTLSSETNGKGDFSQTFSQKDKKVSVNDVSRDVNEQCPDTQETAQNIMQTEAENTSLSVPSPTVKQTNKGDFDPIAEHKSWCPWARLESQSTVMTHATSEGLYPWEILLQMVFPEAFVEEGEEECCSLSSTLLKESPETGMRQIRKILNEWVTPRATESPHTSPMKE